MSRSDIIGDTLTRIRNAQHANHESVEFPTSRMIDSILDILKREGFIGNFTSFKNKEGSVPMVRVELKYHQGKPVIRSIERVSRPGKRIYQKWDDIRPTLNNIGISILSTPRGVVSGKEAKQLHVGGELLCRVY